MDNNKVLHCIPQYAQIKNGIVLSNGHALPADIRNFKSSLHDGIIFFYYQSDLENETVICKCGARMTLRALRFRMAKDKCAVYSYIVQIPRYICKKCRKTRTMRPFFLCDRKHFSIPAIQTIVTEDASEDITVRKNINDLVSANNVRNLRQWTIKIILELSNDGLFDDCQLDLFNMEASLENSDGSTVSKRMLCSIRREKERGLIRYLHKTKGENWFLETIRKFYDVPEIDPRLFE